MLDPERARELGRRGGRRQALQEARRAVEKAQDRLRSGNQGAQALRIQLRVQQERVDRGRRKIAEDEASITHRRRLLAAEESTLATMRKELEQFTGEQQEP